MPTPKSLRRSATRRPDEAHRHAAGRHGNRRGRVGSRQAEPDGCSAIEVTAPGVKKQPRDGRFSTLKILDLDFEARLERADYGDHVLHFRVFTPSGFLYQELNAPFTWPKPKRGRKGDSDDAQAVPVAASYPKGLPVQVLGDVDARRGVVATRSARGCPSPAPRSR